MPILASRFTTPGWLPGPHGQTLWPRVARPPAVGTGTRQRLETDDGDFIDLNWFGPATGPVILLLHGLEGSLESHYAATLIESLTTAGYRCCFMHFRGCSGEPNRLPRSYHSGETGDPAWVVAQLARQGIHFHAAVGVSLGGNVLLKWLGETGTEAPFAAAVAISVPFDLDACARRLERGLSRIYQTYLIGSLRSKYRQKQTRHDRLERFDLDGLATFRQFDDRLTAPLHGFRDVDDYYGRCSSRQYLHAIRVPTLVLHSLDDPFMVPDAVPTESELADCVTLELSERGGHVGFIDGGWPWRPRFWLPQRVVAWLADHDAGWATSRPTTDPTTAETPPAPVPSPSPR